MRLEELEATGSTWDGEQSGDWGDAGLDWSPPSLMGAINGWGLLIDFGRVEQAVLGSGS